MDGQRAPGEPALRKRSADVTRIGQVDTTRDWTMNVEVHYVDGDDGKYLAKELSSALRDLLGWAFEHADGEEEETRSLGRAA